MKRCGLNWRRWWAGRIREVKKISGAGITKERNRRGKKGIMNCTRIETKLMAYLDGRSNARERREVEAHLKTCALCRERAEEFRSVSSLLEELPQIEPSAAFDVRVRARVAAEPESRGWLAWLTPSPRVAFAAMLLLALTDLSQQQQPEANPAPDTM